MMRMIVRSFCLIMLFLSIVNSDLAIGADSRYIRNVKGSQSVIVFVHGILGDGTSTWTAENKRYWPEMLADDDDFNNFDIYVYEYPTSFLNSPFSIDEISENMRLFFDADRITVHKDIIFIAHSMGGLATRAYLLKNRDAASHTRLIYFFSTPTTGSEIASLASLVSANPQLAKMQPMRSADYLGDLQRQWLSANLNIPSFCAYETKKTYGINVVTQASSSNLCNRRLDPIDEDHLKIVKPSSLRSASYLAFKTAVMQTSMQSQEESKWIKFRPIDHLDERLKKLKFPDTNPTVSLRFISRNWQIDHPISISLATSVRELKDALLTQLALKHYVWIDLSRFPAERGCFWEVEWVLTANGKPLDPYSRSLASEGVLDGALLQFRLEWRMLCETGRGFGKAKPEPEALPKKPPDVEG